MSQVYEKNDLVTVSIEDMGTDGEGIGKADGFTLFVKDAVMGDVVQARITKVKKQYAYARLEKVLTPSPFRTEPRCPYHRQCGGCQIQALDYGKQLEYKQQKVRNNLIRIGGFPSAEVDRVMEPIIGMEEPYRYRNKAQYPVGTDQRGNVVTGFYAGRTHTIIPGTECYLGPEENQEILKILVEHMERYHIPAYDEVTGKGQVRHILIRKGFFTGEIMVCLVINGGSGKGEYIPYQAELLVRLSAVKGMTSVSVSINTEKTNVIMGREIHTIWGSPVIQDVIYVRDMQKEGYPCTGQSLTFAISPLSFYQVNPVQTEKLYSLALEYAGLTGREVVWYLYCGIGTISLFLATGAKQVCGVEIVPQAIEDARANARRNGITNAVFYTGKAEEVLPAFYAGEKKPEFCTGENPAGVSKHTAQQKHFDGSEDIAGQCLQSLRHPDVIVVDPPRKGCDEACLNTMLQMQPERIVYVSCDSATLARDLRILCDGGYMLKRVRAVDQFGHTVHVETVCLLSKLHEAKHHVNVTVDMDEMDLTSAESKATYEEIKKYVAEHNDGMKVSNLYIAQVKAKYGIIERENYNLPKSEDTKHPQCPKEKEDAIVDALRFFRMI